MHTIIMLLLGLSYLNFVDNAHNEKGYYSYSLDHHISSTRCTVSPCPDPKDY